MKGFTLIDVLVGCSLMLIIFLGLFGVFRLGMKVVFLSRSRVEATALAKGEMEKVRNLSYDKIGVEGSFPDGVLEASTDVISNQVQYTITRRVDFVPDLTDGMAPPEDECPNDYKKVEIKVSWQDKFPGEARLVTDIAPKNLSQECAISGGILSISVFDSLGIMIASPLIEIEDPSTGEVLKTATPFDGEHYFSLAPGTYKVVVSKTGFNSERSYGTDEIATPEKPHPIVLEGQVTEVSFSIDKISSMTVQARGTRGAGYPVIHNVIFTLTGAKIIGLDSEENPVPKYSQAHTTNGAALIEIANLEWDSYTFSVDREITGLDLLAIESPPGTEVDQPVDLLPDTQIIVRLVLKAENSFLVTVQDFETEEPIFSASVRLQNVGLEYDETQYTDEKGQTYFIPLEIENYTLDIEAPGYNSFSGAVSISGDVIEIIGLERIE